MAMQQAALLVYAIEIAKEYAKSGGDRSIEVVLEEVFRKLQALSKEI